MKNVDITSFVLDNIAFFLLVFARITGMFFTAPVFNQGTIPSYVKIGFSLILSFLILPFIKISQDILMDNFYSLFFYITKELLVGMLIGFIGYLFFSSIYLAGHLMDMEMGFSMVQVINPMDDTEIPITANLLTTIAMLVFLSVNGHHRLIQALLHSFEMIPIGKLSMNQFMYDKIITIFVTSFIIGFKIGAPIVVSIFLANILLGIMARTMPQMNVFVVGMPLKIFLGLIVIFMISSLYIGFFEYIFDIMFDHMDEFIKLSIKG
ncbi:MAG: flagellar biosynthetic protein FliR [Bacillota bacterium]